MTDYVTYWFAWFSERNFQKLIPRKPHVPIWKFLKYLKDDQMNFKIMWSVVLETERILRKINLNWKNNEKKRFFPILSDVTCHNSAIIRPVSMKFGHNIFESLDF